MSAYTIVTVLHDSAPELRVLLDSLDRHLRPRPPLVVVDSGSRDDGAQLARDRGVEVVALESNRGFGAANNAGVERVRTPLTVMLNPDIELLDDSLPWLAARAGARDALVAPRLLNPDGTVQRTAHPVPGSLAGCLLALPGVAEPWRSDRPRTVGWAIAAALAARTGTLRRDDAAQAVTFASRALLRGRRSREAAQLGALLAARRG